MEAERVPKGTEGVVVLGMHRSGTSAVAGFLAKAGFFAGEEADLLPAAEDNPTGFFERLDVNGINDKVFAELGGTWDNPPSRELLLQRAPALQAKAKKVLRSLAAGAGGRPLVLKDPRMCLLLPAWLPALGEKFAIVVVDRNPLEVAMSMRKRDGRPLFVDLALWQLYCTELVNGLAGRRVWFVRYEDLVASPAQQASALLEQLSALLPDAAKQGLARGDEAGSFVSSGLRHQRAAPKGTLVEQLLTGAQLALWRWLSRLPEGWVTLGPPEKLRDQSEEALAAVAEDYTRVGEHYGLEVAYDTQRHMALHFEQATELKEHHIELIEAQLGELKRQLAAQVERAARLEEGGEELRAANETLREELRRLHEDSRAAASNLISVARRSWASGAGH